LVTFNDNVIVRRPTKINPLGEESIAQLRLHPQTRTRTALTQATPTTTFRCATAANLKRSGPFLHFEE